jgi:phosphoribosylformylglycinamidine synthase
LKITNNETLITNNYQKPIIKIPIAHGEGRFFADEKTVANLFKNKQVIFQYCNDKGETGPNANPNGSLSNIAGICNKQKNIFGMMPHPERAADPFLKNTDGINLFKSMFNYIQ